VLVCTALVLAKSGAGDAPASPLAMVTTCLIITDLIQVRSLRRLQSFHMELFAESRSKNLKRVSPHWRFG